MKLLTYKYRIYPTEEQKKYFAVSFAANRWFWNYALGKIQEVFDANKGKEEKERIPSAQYEIARELPLLKKKNKVLLGLRRQMQCLSYIQARTLMRH